MLVEREEQRVQEKAFGAPEVNLGKTKLSADSLVENS